jgi:RNA polymerase sigma factor (sigma-70 family)
MPLWKGLSPPKTTETTAGAETSSEETTAPRPPRRHGMFSQRRVDEKLDSVSDVELVNRLAEGDRVAFTAFYNRYAKLIYYCIRQIEKDLTDDIFQDFFLREQNTQFRALQHWNRGRPLPNFLRQVVRNFTLDKLRKERPHRGHKGSDVLENLVVTSEEVSAQEAIEMRQMREGAIKAWKELPTARDRRLICGKYHRDTPSAATAKRLKLNPGAFRKALFDAQRRYMALVKRAIPEYFSSIT